MVRDGEHEEGRCRKQQAQQEQPQHLHDHPRREDALYRPRRGQHQIQVGVQQQGIDAKDETAENQDPGVSEERKAQQLHVVDPHGYSVCGLETKPGDYRLP